MSKGSIVDYRIQIKISKKLIDFIVNLHDLQQMPENIIKIYETFNRNRKEKSKKEALHETYPQEKISENQINLLKSFKTEEIDFDNLKNILKLNVKETEDEFVEDEGTENFTEDKKNGNEKLKLNKSFYLELNDLRWIHKVIQDEYNSKNETNKIYLHELLEGSELILPENEIIPRNPELEARCKRLRAEQATREYRNMTKNVDSSRRDQPDDTIGYQIKVINRQLIAVLQFIFSVAAGFAFGFLGVELILGNLDFGFRLLLGIICALIIALAEIYFLAKKLNEYDDTDETQHNMFQTNDKKEHKD